MTLNADQQILFDAVLSAVATPRRLIVAAPAGTGKTYTVKKLQEHGLNIVKAAPTHRAASLIGGITVASLLKSRPNDPLSELKSNQRKLDARMEALPPGRNRDAILLERSELRDLITRRERDGDEMKFYAKGVTLTTKPDLVVIDEAFMITAQDAEMINTIPHEMGIAVLLLGDPSQLPPVKAQSGYSDSDANYRLQTIMRGDGPAELGKIVRENRRYRSQELLQGMIRNNKADFGRDLSMSADITLCAFNSDVQIINRMHVKDLTRTPKTGDLLLSRTRIMGASGMDLTDLKLNPKPEMIYKGERFSVVQAGQRTPTLVKLVIQREHDKRMFKVVAPTCVLEDHMDFKHLHNMPAFAWGYAMTVHSAQGGEWDHVHFVARQGKFSEAEYRALVYTAITRARKRVSLSGSLHA